MASAGPSLDWWAGRGRRTKRPRSVRRAGLRPPGHRWAGRDRGASLGHSLASLHWACRARGSAPSAATMDLA